ncbi:DUF4360 domain-containing protein [Streptomyces sp. NPDC005533]|uniref:DUF4360 domain-containing protein n=1 Tax=Streptomyces sp. NPDC005533 TaxID=3364723 RepID=UPI0036772867
MRGAVLIFGTMTALLAAPLHLTPAVASTAAPPGQVSIEVVNVNGSGCPAGTTAVAVAPDNTAFTVTYSQYTAQSGRDSSPIDFRKNCQIALNVHVPQGYTYAIARADYRGFAHLERSATALQRANYYFAGMSENAAVNHRFNGPMNDNWQNSDNAAAETLVYAPCEVNRLLNINTELRVKSSSADASVTSFISMDSTDGSINTLYHFAWKRCP